MHIDISEMVKMSDKESFVGVFSGLLDWYTNTYKHLRDFEPDNLMFTCFDLITILRANNQEIKPPTEEWSAFLTRPQKVELFDMICNSIPREVIEQHAFEFINNNNRLIYRVKLELFNKLEHIKLSYINIAKNVYDYSKN